ncbi:hypothetical protein HanRHA438_Chr17g0796881 [Helianthus annuus]|nr:hypothetical protein HanRHA438_Chr17g0796881 [Helianthus annuus]
MYARGYSTYNQPLHTSLNPILTIFDPHVHEAPPLKALRHFLTAPRQWRILPVERARAERHGH